MGDEAGVYAATETGFAFTVTGPAFRTETIVHILFPDGRYRFDWPGEGLDADLAADAHAYPHNWGTWARAGDGVEIERAGGRWFFLLEPDALVGDGGKRFTRLADASARVRGLASFHPGGESQG